MEKIPTLFVRDEKNRHFVTRDVTPGCNWVIAGEGYPTRKWDGTCMRYDGHAWWARRSVKPGKKPPENYVVVETDVVTGKSFGWEPVEQSPFASFYLEARNIGTPSVLTPGTYELVGPAINGNPEDLGQHVLLRHGAHPLDVPNRSYDEILAFLRDVPWLEGIVFYRTQGDAHSGMVKIKRRDFRELA